MNVFVSLPTTKWRLFSRGLTWLATVGVLAGCGSAAIRQAEELRRANQLPQAWRVLDEAAKAAPHDHELKGARLHLREQLSAQLLMQVEALRMASRWDAGTDILGSLRQIDPQHPRLAQLELELRRGARHELLLAQARALLKEGKPDSAEARVREVLAENPVHAIARSLLSQVAQARPIEAPVLELGPEFQRPVNLEFRDAPLRQVFETLARTSQVNFVFDKDVRPDARVTVFLRGVTLDEAIRIILATQQLDRKLLNESSLMIFPASGSKQREHQELVTRTMYLTNADVKQAQALVKTIAKVRDVHIDERLNLMVVRDTPEVMRLVEKLVASVDLPEPEVMLDVEVMELSRDNVEALGLQWPESVQFGLPGVAANGLIQLGQRDQFRGSIANPAALATLRGTTGNTNLLANPKIRVRNKDKALVHVGEKLPVFTSTTAANVGVASNVSYLDIGLKLEVEPVVQLDNDVTIKVAMEVSNLIRQVAGPVGAVAYEIGTRKTTTTLRLADGETQVLAGLINDEDRRSSSGVPGLSRLPLLGRLFGVHTDTRSKTEVVLLITPRIVRNLSLPDYSFTQLPSGTDASPGAFSTRLLSKGRTNLGLNVAPQTAVGAPTAGPSPTTPALKDSPAGVAPASDEVARLRLDVTPQAPAGGTVTVLVRNESSFSVSGRLAYDATKLSVLGGAPGTPGELALDLAPGKEVVMVMRALPAASGQTVTIAAEHLAAKSNRGTPLHVQVDGMGRVTVDAAR